MSKTSKFRRIMRPVVWETLSALLRPTVRFRVLPDYVIVGTQRGGTTSLQNLLTSHPNITSARLMKGVHYFDTGYHRGPNWYRLQFPTRLYARRVKAKTGSPLRVGDASPYYMFHPLAAERIAADLPEVKVIAVLRDPVERTISHHKHEVRRGNEHLTLSEALDAEKTRLEGEAGRIRREQPQYRSYAHQTYSYVARGHYADQVARLIELFGAERVLVVSSEQLFTDPESHYEELFDFLDVPQWTPSAFPHMNPTADKTVDDSVRRRLSDEFSASNSRLFELLGREWPWQ